MTIIQEMGLGQAGSETYASVADADTYFAARNSLAWGDLDLDVKEACLRLAMDYMAEAYRARWKGYRSQIAQSLDWPRQAVTLTDLAINYMVPYNSVPAEIKAAQIELAGRAYGLGVTRIATDLDRASLSESVSGVSVSYDRFSPQQTRYRQIDMLLMPFLTSSGTMMQLGRV
jgi:hypothetical protein